jgi:hypothetical protein
LAGRYRAGLAARAGRAQLASLVVGAAVIIVSFLLNAGVVLDGGTPTDFAWPLFAAGMAIGIVGATGILRTAAPIAERQPRTA